MPWGTAALWRTPADRRRHRVLHPAGHVLGSAQIRVEHRGEIWVVSGDYKLAPDPTCAPFEPSVATPSSPNPPLGCPSTAGVNRPESLRRYRCLVARESASGPRQRPLRVTRSAKHSALIAGLDPSIGPILCHGAVEHHQPRLPSAASRFHRHSTPTTLRKRLTGPAPWSRAAVCQWQPLRCGSSVLFPPALLRDGCASAARVGATPSTAASSFGPRRLAWPALRHRCHGRICVLATHGYRTPLVRWLPSMDSKRWRSKRTTKANR